MIFYKEYTKGKVQEIPGQRRIRHHRNIQFQDSFIDLIYQNTKYMEVSEHPLDAYINTQKPNYIRQNLIGLQKQYNILWKSVNRYRSSHQQSINQSSHANKWLVYGVPGVGKTHLIKTLASESKYSYFQIYGHDLIINKPCQMWKFIKYFFQKAQSNKPSLIVIDQFQNFSGKKCQDESDKLAKNELINQIEKISPDTTLIISTQRPWNIDQTILSKLEGRIYLNMPYLQCRQKFIKSNLKSFPNTISQLQINEIAKRTEGYTLSDLMVVVKDVMMEPLRRIMNANKFCLTEGKWRPCKQGEEGLQKNVMEFQQDQLYVVPTLNDFQTSLSMSRPSNQSELIQKYQEWNTPESFF